MHLWTEYEGRTVAEHYTLGKLLRSEGRNGFFATADKDGHPAVIRLTEAHFDEAELLSRWRQVAEVHQDNLIEIEQVGQTTFEGVALTYALMEPEDANLGEVLTERPLTTAEALQVAKAVLAALQALHASGLVHEHLEPSNVLAVGETVKLRSDCVRECVAHPEFDTAESCAELRRRDLQGFGTLLLRCLTLESEWSPAHNNLPDPFKRVIPRALDGTWTLEQLRAAVDPAAATSRRSAAVATPGIPGQSPASPLPLPGPNLNAAHERRPLIPPGVRQAPVSDRAAVPSRPAADPTAAKEAEPVLPIRSRFDATAAEPSRGPSKIVWAVGAALVLLVLLSGWRFFSGGKPASSGQTAPVVSSGATTRPEPSVPAKRAAAPSQTSTAPGGSPAGAESRSSGTAGWYVIAYTYNREGQAATKAQRLRRTHNSLHPQVFSADGRAPYFVSLGGAMTQEQAEGVLRHARRAGLPRDTFMRHY